MKRAFPKIRTLLASALLVASASWGATAEQRTLEQKFDAQLQASDLQAWMKQMSAKPTHVGAPHAAPRLEVEARVEAAAHETNAQRSVGALRRAPRGFWHTVNY